MPAVPPSPPPSPLARFIAAVRVGVQAAGDVKAAAARGLCVNCQTRPTAGVAKLCDTCGENAAEASVTLLGNALEGAAYDKLKAFFTGRSR